MTNREAFGSYGKSVAVIFSCAFSVFFAQEIGSPIINGCISLALFLITFFIFRSFKKTDQRFLIAVSAIAAATFLAFCLNSTISGTTLGTVLGLVLFILLITLVAFAFMRPSGSAD